MKPFKFIFPLVLIALAVSLWACQKPDDSPKCDTPMRTLAFPSTASRWLFQPMKPGDSLKFKVYHRNDRNSGYIYQRDETYTIKDTVIKPFQVVNIFRDDNHDCNEFMTSDYLVADMAGPQKMTCELDNLSYTTLHITFRGKDLGVGDIQYKSHITNWNDSLTIGGEKYYNVKNFQGVNSGSNYYIDSTYCFYNLQYGIVKFIINDTLIYERNLH